MLRLTFLFSRRSPVINFGVKSPSLLQSVFCFDFHRIHTRPIFGDPRRHLYRRQCSGMSTPSAAWRSRLLVRQRNGMMPFGFRTDDAHSGRRPNDNRSPACTFAATTQRIIGGSNDISTEEGHLRTVAAIGKVQPLNYVLQERGAGSGTGDISLTIKAAVPNAQQQPARAGRSVAVPGLRPRRGLCRGQRRSRSGVGCAAELGHQPVVRQHNLQPVETGTGRVSPLYKHVRL